MDDARNGWTPEMIVLEQHVQCLSVITIVVERLLEGKATPEDIELLAKASSRANELLINRRSELLPHLKKTA